MPGPAPTRSRGAAGLLIAVLVVVAVLLWLPAMRWFFLFSFIIGAVIAAGLYFWHKHKPVRVEDDRPLKLD